MATFDYNRTNLGAASLSSPITAAATTATVGASDAATFPTAPFYATIMPVGETPNQLNSEIVQVTANNSGALGLVRAQRGTTAKAFDAGALVMNGVYIQDLEQAQAVGKSFFSATLTSGVYYINDSRVPTTPADGDSIRVVFGSNWTSGTPQLSLNNGTAKNIYAGNNLTSGNASTTTNAMVKSGVIYELTYYNGNWYVLNLVANNSITSDNMDWTTIVWEDYTVTAPSGYTIIENQCRINRSLKLFIVSLRLIIPDSGTGNTYADGLPEPSGNVSMPLFARVEKGTLVNQTPGVWKRAVGGSIGCVSWTKDEIFSVQIGGLYPIK